jgi:hypothetical protein
MTHDHIIGGYECPKLTSVAVHSQLYAHSHSLSLHHEHQYKKKLRFLTK